MSNDEINTGQLRAFIERLTQEKRALGEDINEVYAEAKGNGFDVKIIRKIISIRAQDADQRAEEETLIDSTSTRSEGTDEQPRLH